MECSWNFDDDAKDMLADVYSDGDVVFEKVSNFVKDLLEKDSIVGNDIFEKVLDDNRDIFEEVYNDNHDKQDWVALMSKPIALFKKKWLV